MIRHLLYSVFAASHTKEWLLNVKKLCEYSSVFTGRKIVVVRSENGVTESPEAVEAAFTFPVEFVHVQNDRKLQETAHFIELLGRFQRDDLGEDEILFYAHTKGVKYDASAPQLPFIRDWRDAMYHACLDNMELVEERLEQHPCAGSFIKCRPINKTMTRSSWYYSGNFWWVRLAELFRCDWTFIHDHSHAVEAYLGALFDYNPRSNILFTESDLNELHRKVGPYCPIPVPWSSLKAQHHDKASSV
jgi:hypothetical protein